FYTWRASFFFQAEDGIRDFHVTGVQTCALPICVSSQQAPAVRVWLPQKQAWPCSRHNHERTRCARRYWANRLAVGDGLPRLETTRRRCRILATRTTVRLAQSADTFESRESCAHRRCTRCHSF